MTTSKAVAGGISSAATSLVLFLLKQVPFIAQFPEEQIAALTVLVGAAIGYGFVYYAPANTASGVTKSDAASIGV